MWEASCCNTIKSNQMVGVDRMKPSGRGAGGITEAPCQRGIINGLRKKSRVHLTVRPQESGRKTAERWLVRASNGRISQHPDSPGDSPVFTPENVNHRPRGGSPRLEGHAHPPLQLPAHKALCVCWLQRDERQRKTFQLHFRTRPERTRNPSPSVSFI